jgi:hypothetical protein
MYALNLAEDGRILSATYAKYAPANAVIVDILPDGNISEYLYVNGGYVYDPLPKTVEPEAKATVDDVLNALLGVNRYV